MKKRLFAAFVAMMLTLSPAAASALGTEAPGLDDSRVNEMFTKRDFETGYESFESIALSDGASTSDSRAVSIDGDKISIAQQGVYKISGSLSNGQIIVRAPETAKVELVLDGADISCTGSAAIYVVSADKVFVTTEKGSKNALSSFGKLKDDKIDSVVYSANDVCFKGEGMLKISSEQGHGIATKDDLKICSGSYEIKAAKRGLSGKDSIRIGGGDIWIESGSDGLHSEHNDADKGFIFISGGSVSVKSGKDGIDCTNYMSLLSGDIRIVAESDGINAAAENDAYTGNLVEIAGGRLEIQAMEDGIDSNGSIKVSGGELLINAAPRGGDSALDCGAKAEILGGSVIAVSAKDMAANFTESAQGSILCVFESAHRAGEEVFLSDRDGNTVLSYAPELDYQAVVFSSDDIAADGEYIVSAGNESLEIKMSGNVYGQGFGPMGGMPPAGEFAAPPPDGPRRPWGGFGRK